MRPAQNVAPTAPLAAAAVLAASAASCRPRRRRFTSQTGALPRQYDVDALAMVLLVHENLRRRLGAGLVPLPSLSAGAGGGMQHPGAPTPQQQALLRASEAADAGNYALLLLDDCGDSNSRGGSALAPPSWPVLYANAAAAEALGLGSAASVRSHWGRLPPPSAVAAIASAAGWRTPPPLPPELLDQQQQQQKQQQQQYQQQGGAESQCTPAPLASVPGCMLLHDIAWDLNPCTTTTTTTTTTTSSSNRDYSAHLTLDSLLCCSVSAPNGAGLDLCADLITHRCFFHSCMTVGEFAGHAAAAAAAAGSEWCLSLYVL
jgi:hypothetical protein